MSVELISVLVAVLAIGATLAGVILTSNRGLRKDMREDMKQGNRGCGRTWGSWSPGCETTSSNWGTAWGGWSIAKPSSKACWKACARPSPGGRRPARDNESVPKEDPNIDKET